MVMQNGKPVTFRARGLSDARDGTNAFPGAMLVLQNMIPDPGTDGIFVPRPAAVGLAGGGANPTLWGSFTWGQATWGGFDSVDGAGTISALKAVGNIYYGMIAATSGTFAGKDVPFAYNLATLSFLSISIPGGVTSLPTTQPTTGDWTPPTVAVIGGRVVFTHPGFAGGGAPSFGWLDISGFISSTLTGNTHATTTIDGLASDVLTDGWQVGMPIADTAGDIPANTTLLSIAADGLSATLSNAATGSHTGTTFTVSGGTSSAPVWGSGNTNGNPLFAVPVAVSNFNARAYYAVPGEGLVFSDPGNATQVTQATQALTTQNGLDVTALGGLPVYQSSGGILAALIGFQGDAEMQMVTGDALESNLTINALGVGVGCLAPNTICQTPLGLTFVAPDGLRYVNFIGQVSDPIGKEGTGVLVPFLNALFPSRMAAAYNQDVFRVTVQNATTSDAPFQDYWFHLSRKIWSGPHSFTYALVQPYQGTPNHGFVLVGTNIPAELFRSEVTPTIDAIYVELGVPMNCVWKTSLIPDNRAMAENRVNDSMLAAQLPAGALVGVTAQDEQGSIIDQVELAGAASAGTPWGSFNWGQANWQASAAYFVQYDLPWHTALVFKQATFSASAVALAGLAIGNFYFRYQALGYRTQVWPFVASAAG